MCVCVCVCVVGDTDCDIPFNVDSNQYIVWAIGGVEQTAFRHNFRSDGKIKGNFSYTVLLHKTGV